MKAAAKMLASAVALAALALPATAGIAATPKRPTDPSQGLRDGCQRNGLGLLHVQTPEWVYVNHDPRVHMASGITRIAHPSSSDEPGTHVWLDFLGDLAPDAPFRYLVAGSRTAGTGNFGAGDADGSEGFGRLHYEWEQGSVPMFVWPSDGDRTTIWGSWIWDCGHWTVGGRVTGEHTEFHPLSAIAVTRRNPSEARAGESETDAYISSHGTFAHAVEACAHRLKPRQDGTYGPGYFPCERNRRNQRQPLARSYTFDVPAPPRPAGARALELRTVSRVSSGRATARVASTPNGFAVTITPHGRSVRWGRSYFAHWAGAAPKGSNLRVTLNDILIKRSDPDPTEGGPDPVGEPWALWVEVNGAWRLVNDWAPSLASLHDGMRIHLDKTIPVTVQRGRDLHLFMVGTDCDLPSGVVQFGHFVPRVKPCALHPTESRFGNDDPGTVLDRYRSAAAGVGRHVAKSRPAVAFPGIGALTFGDGKMGDDDYELTYTVNRAR